MLKPYNGGDYVTRLKKNIINESSDLSVIAKDIIGKKKPKNKALANTKDQWFIYGVKGYLGLIGYSTGEVQQMVKEYDLQGKIQSGEVDTENDDRKEVAKNIGSR